MRRDVDYVLRRAGEHTRRSAHTCQLCGLKSDDLEEFHGEAAELHGGRKGRLALCCGCTINLAREIATRLPPIIVEEVCEVYEDECSVRALVAREAEP